MSLKDCKSACVVQAKSMTQSEAGDGARRDLRGES